MQSISPQIADGVQRFKGLDWNTIGKGAAISGVVAVIGVGAVNLLEGGGSSGGGGNPFRKREQRQYYVLDGYSDAWANYNYQPGLVNRLLEKKISREQVCLSSKNNAISQNTLSNILASGGKVVSQGSQYEQTVKSGYNIAGSLTIYVECAYIPYIIEE